MLHFLEVSFTYSLTEKTLKDRQQETLDEIVVFITASELSTLRRILWLSGFRRHNAAYVLFQTIIIIILSERHTLLDIDLPQMSPQRPVLCFAHPTEVVGSELSDPIGSQFSD